MKTTDRFRTLEEKIDKIVDHVHSIDKTMERNTASLEEHMRRTELLEKKLEPVESHVVMVNGVLKFISLIGMIVAIIGGLYKIFGLS